MPDIILAQDPEYIKTQRGQTIEVYKFSEAYDSEDKEYINDYWKDMFPNATFVDNASTTYNCHSYAWNMSDGGPTCWINQKDKDKNINIRKYWTNDFYVPTTSKGKARRIYYGDDVDHSGVLCPLGSTTVKSKWGPGPLMIHSIEDCPYGPLNDTDYKSDSIQFFLL